MKKLDKLFLKCLGHNIYDNQIIFKDTVTNNTYPINIIDNNNFRISFTWCIPIGDDKETKEIMKNLNEQISVCENVIKKLKEVLAVSDEDKMRYILDNLDKLEIDV